MPHDSKTKDSSTAAEMPIYPDASEVVEYARSLFGNDAPTAVAYCGLDAWFEGKEDEVRDWVRIFNRLKS